MTRNKSEIYRTWHEHPSHTLFHWVGLFAISIAVFTFVQAAIFNYSLDLQNQSFQFSPQTLQVRAATNPLSVKINFQPTGVPVPAGYLADDGAPYGDRGNGYSYGWSAANQVATRDRNDAKSPDQRYDTLIHMQGLSWEIALPNDTYSVRVVAGDPTFPDVVAKTNAEGAVALNANTTAANLWLEATVTVAVNDGRLTLADTSGTSYNKLDFVEITSATGPPAPAPSPTPTPTPPPPTPSH